MIYKLAQATGMNYCGRNCNCGEPSYLMMHPVGADIPEWLPGWTNGVTPEELYDWIQKAAMETTAIRDAMRTAGLRVNYATAS